MVDPYTEMTTMSYLLYYQTPFLTDVFLLGSFGVWVVIPDRYHFFSLGGP